MSTPANNASPPVLAQVVDNNTTACIVSLSMTMTHADVRRMLARHFSPNVLEQRRVAERDAALRAIAHEDCRKITKPTERAHEIVRRLSRYGGGAYRFERNRPPEDPARARLHRVLALQEGRVPSFSTVWRALAGAP